MKSVLRGITLLIVATLVLSVGCSCPASPIQPVTTVLQSTTQSAATITSSPATTLTTPTDQAGTLTVHFIDIGQGDSELIQTSSGATMLIDGGDTGTGIVQYLKSQGITKLDVVIATHPHADHIGGLVQVLQAIPVAKVITNGQPTTTKTYENFLDAISAAKAQYVEVKRGDTINLDKLVFTVLSPVNIQGDDLNNNSIVLRLVYGNVSFLFEGDAQADAEASMMASSISPVTSTILKVGHHGSRTASSPAFLALVKPKIAIYSAGINNVYGHPHPETMAALAAVGATVYGTDVNGTVIVTTDGNTYNVIPTNGQPRAPPGILPMVNPTTTPVLMTTTIPVPSSGALNLDIISVTSPVKAGANAILTAQTIPGASCTITVTYKSGPSQAQGLEPKVADATGQVSWTWKVGISTTPGTWSISVMSSKDGQTIAKDTTFEVTI